MAGIVATLGLAGLSGGAYATSDIFQITNQSSNALFQLPGITNPGATTTTTGYPGVAGAPATNSGASQPAGLFFLDRNNPQPTPGSGEWVQDINNGDTTEPGVSAQSTGGEPAGFGSWYWIGQGSGTAVTIDHLGSGKTLAQTNNSIYFQYGASNGVVAYVSALVKGNPNGTYRSEIDRTITLYNFGASTNVKFYGLSNLGLTQVYTGGSLGNGYSGWGNAWSNGWDNNVNNVATVNSATATVNSVTQTNSFATGGVPISQALDSITGGALPGDPLGNPTAIALGDAATLQTNFNAGMTGLTGGLIANLNNDPAFAFMYNLTLAQGASYTINDTLVITPEPASLILLALGGAFIVSPRRRQKA